MSQPPVRSRYQLTCHPLHFLDLGRLEEKSTKSWWRGGKVEEASSVLAYSPDGTSLRCGVCYKVCAEDMGDPHITPQGLSSSPHLLRDITDFDSSRRRCATAAWWRGHNRRCRSRI